MVSAKKPIDLSPLDAMATSWDTALLRLRGGLAI
jgi:hypothetical protein